MFSRNLSLIIRSSPASPAPTPSTAPLVGAAQSLGLGVTEHAALTYTLARDAQTGAVTVTYSEPVGCPVKFHWTTTITLDGTSASTPVAAG